MGYKILPSTSVELVPRIRTAMDRLLEAYELQSDSPQPLNITGFVPTGHNPYRPHVELEVIIEPRGKKFLLNLFGIVSNLSLAVTLKKDGKPAELVSSGPDSAVLTFDEKTYYFVHHTWSR